MMEILTTAEIDPSKPEFAGCAAMDGYVHDAQCLIYKGPHTKYLVGSL